MIIKHIKKDKNKNRTSVYKTYVYATQIRWILGL
jgi:hypothetical protein